MDHTILYILVIIKFVFIREMVHTSGFSREVFFVVFL
jgi:hypothetical protein